MSEVLERESLANVLGHFHSAGRTFRHQLARNVLYTDGVQYMAEHARAYWLIDEIAIAQIGVPALRGKEFQSWRLAVAENKSATLSVDDGNGHVLFEKTVSWTTFPLPEIKLWVSHGVIMLPSEY